MAERLTEKQAAVLEFLQRRLDRGEPPPTNQEICDEFGWGSTRSARDHLRALARKRYVELSRWRGHRGIRLISPEAPVTRVPLLGRIVAGTPVVAEENVEARVPVPSRWAGGGGSFALRVSGDSMQGAGILDGDLVVVRNDVAAQDGDIVVATLEGETTLKRIRLRGRGATLVAENRRYRRIPVRTESAAIQGVVVALLRAYPAATARRPGQFRRASPVRSSTRREVPC